MAIYRYSPDELYHFGVKGMQWGRRRYQNEDGSYKSGAEGRYNPSEARKAAIKGGVIGYVKYRRSHTGRKEALRQEKINKKRAKTLEKKKKLAKREAKDREFSKKHLGMTDEEYDNAMNAVAARQKAKSDAKAAKQASKPQYKVSEAKDAALKGGLIGYGKYRITHKGRKQAIALDKANKTRAANKAKKEKLAKREAKDREFSKKHLGMTDKEYDNAMNAANASWAKRKKKH